MKGRVWAGAALEAAPKDAMLFALWIREPPSWRTGGPEDRRRTEELPSP